MTIQLNQKSNSKILAVRLSDKLKKSDYKEFVPEVERLLQQHGKLRMLFEMENFHGWEGDALWEDAKFGVKHYADIERIAMVGENKWQHGMAILCKPFTKAQVRYFEHADVAGAREWLENA